MLPSDLVQYKKKSQKIIALTAWDSISGSIAEQANVDLVLVGDSLAMVCLGYKSTFIQYVRKQRFWCFYS